MPTIDVETYRRMIKDTPDVKSTKKESSIRLEPEHELQVAAVNWFRLLLKDKIIFAIPNGGHRHKSQGIKLKKEGVLRGVSDLLCIDPNGKNSGFFAETKYGNNDLTDEQSWFFEEAKKRNYHTFKYYTLEEFILNVENYFNLKF